MRKIIDVLSFFVLISCLGCSSDESIAHSTWQVKEGESASDMAFVADATSDVQDSMADQPFYRDRPVEISACTDDFVAGPVWHFTRDQQAAIEESMWIAGMFVRPDVFFHEDDDTQERWDKLLERLTILGIEKLDTLEGPFIAVYGEPKSILKLIEESCDVIAFDLTGFHCDCAPEMCEQGRTCRYPVTTMVAASNHHGWSESQIEEAWQLAQILYGYSPIIGCHDDVTVHPDQISIDVIDFRGVSWTASSCPMKSWQRSTCPRLPNRDSNACH